MTANVLILRYVLLQGIEDYMGDMDFKMAGTKQGVTALQVLKPYLSSVKSRISQLFVYIECLNYC